MRKILSGAAVLAIGMSLTSLTAPASATTYSSDSCSAATSWKLVTNELLGSDENRVWIESPTLTRRIVCFDLPFGNTGGGAIVVDATPGGTAPSVVPGNDPASCPFYAVNSTNPVLFRLGFNQATSTVCIVLEDKTLTLAFSAGSPSGLPQIEVWRDGRAAALDIAACPVDYTLQLLGGPNTCIRSNSRII